MPDTATALFVFLFGLVVGSFLNVCIARLPSAVTDDRITLFNGMRRQLRAITFPPSACPKCGAKIRPYDNIPLFSYIFLRGRCRGCRTAISPRYPAVELATGLLFIACYTDFGLSPVAAKWAAFCAMMLVLIFTDLRERILPDLVTLGGTLFGLVLSLLIPVGDGSALWLARKAFEFPPPAPALSFADALLGAAFGGGVLWLVAEGYFRLRGREGMGLGDVKMMAMIGAFLGIKLTFLTLFAASLAGSVIGVAFVLAFRKDSSYELPFGVFLAVGALLSLFWGPPLVAWYASLV